MQAAVERWDRLKDTQDTRVISVCSELRLPMFYSCPCLVQHAPMRSAFSTPTAYAPDFRDDFRLELGEGFQPPESVPGWLTQAEGKLLWELAADQVVLELGTACGRSTICSAQRARRVVSVDRRPQTEAAEWLRRYGLLERVTFRHDDVASLRDEFDERFTLAFIDTEHDAESVARDIEFALKVLEPVSVIAFHDYPDPGWPEVRKVVDDYASRLGWQRVAQADYMGAFRMR
jgi:predicted O-methyltransferase YrrM